MKKRLRITMKGEGNTGEVSTLWLLCCSKENVKHVNVSIVEEVIQHE